MRQDLTEMEKQRHIKFFAAQLGSRKFFTNYPRIRLQLANLNSQHRHSSEALIPGHWTIHTYISFISGTWPIYTTHTPKHTRNTGTIQIKDKS